MQIASRQTGAADVQLARYADRLRVHVSIEHERPSIRNRAADRDRGGLLRDALQQGARSRRSWFRLVRTRGQAALAARSAKSDALSRIDGFAAEHHLPKPLEDARVLGCKLAEQGRRDEHDPDAVPLDRRRQLSGVSSTSLRTTTSRAPFSSAPQISKVAASNAALEACAITSDGPSCT